MFNLLGSPSYKKYETPQRQTLIQKCSCGAQMEIEVNTWNPGPLITTWLRTHPCPNRTTANPLGGLGRPVH